jgi:hypothetical protein
MQYQIFVYDKYTMGYTKCFPIYDSFLDAKYGRHDLERLYPNDTFIIREVVAAHA